MAIRLIKETVKGQLGLAERARNFLDSDNGAATLTKTILAIAAVGGIFFIGAVAPNVVQLLGRHRRLKHYLPQQLKTSYHKLKHRGLIKLVIGTDGRTLVRLTEKGERRLDRLDLDAIRIVKPKTWDKKWRVLIFDIPVRFRKAREALRWKIKELGFWQLQKSVWVYPYPCAEELIFVAEFFGVLPHVEILTVEKVLRSGELERRFNL